MATTAPMMTRFQRMGASAGRLKWSYALRMPMKMPATAKSTTVGNMMRVSSTARSMVAWSWLPHPGANKWTT